MPETIYYDGYCGLCHGAVRFVAQRDVDGLFIFAPLEGEYARETISKTKRSELPDSLIVLKEDGELLARSDATAHILIRLGGVWGGAGWLMRLVPRPIRDLGYSMAARLRRRLFAKPNGVCPVVPNHLRDRFRQ